MTDLLTALEEGDVQTLIDDGGAWHLEGHVGRTMMAAIEAGDAMLGPRPVRDYYGNLIPAWWMVESGTKGSPEFAGLERPEEPDDATKRELCEAIGLEVADRQGPNGDGEFTCQECGAELTDGLRCPECGRAQEERPE